MNGSRKCDTHTHPHTHTGILFSLKKEGNPIICDKQMDEPTEHYTKWSKPGRERQILCGITYMWNLKKKKVKLTGKVSIKVFARDCGWGK